MRVGVLNITGYIGSELARLLYRHPAVKLVSVTGRSAQGQRVGDIFPHLNGLDLPIAGELDTVDLAFSALPHKSSAEAVIPLLEQGIRVIDLSADFRLKEPAQYSTWYGFVHPAPSLLGDAVYGLVELNRPKIPAARLIASPGCYPTSALLALAPAFAAGMIEPDIVIDSKSGVSGAGRTLSLSTHYSEVNENVQAYSLEGHRHLPEIVQELSRMSPSNPPRVVFVPHLVPMTRGILTTCYAPLSKATSRAEVREVYCEYYRGEPFVKVVEASPQTKHTWGNNQCLLYPHVDERTGRLIVLSCLDNLVKGGAGQAIQCMNLMLGLPETTGLEALAVYP